MSLRLFKDVRAPCFGPDTDLKGLLSCVDELVALEFGALDESLAALCADVNAGSVGMQMLPHGRVIPEHLCAALWGEEE